MGGYTLHPDGIEVIFIRDGVLSEDRVLDILNGFDSGIVVGERRGISKLQIAFHNLMNCADRRGS